MTALEFLAKLGRVRRAGANRWMACCPAHQDRSPSLSIREGDDGRILLHCFAGCEAARILAALGLGTRDLFPSGRGWTPRPYRAPRVGVRQEGRER